MLDSVSTGLIERVTGLDVGVDFLVNVIAHGDVCNADIGDSVAVAHAEQGKPGVNLMRVSA